MMRHFLFFIFLSLIAETGVACGRNAALEKKAGVLSKEQRTLRPSRPEASIRPAGPPWWEPNPSRFLRPLLANVQLQGKKMDKKDSGWIFPGKNKASLSAIRQQKQPCFLFKSGNNWINCGNTAKERRTAPMEEAKKAERKELTGARSLVLCRSLFPSQYVFPLSAGAREQLYQSAKNEQIE